MIRKNLTKKFHTMMQNTLTMILAPDGYGKTSYLKYYLKKGKVHNIWVDGKEQGDVDYFWKTIIMEMPNEEIKSTLLCYQIIPNSQLEIATLLEMWDQQLKKDVMIIMDDFHKFGSQDINYIVMAISKLKLNHLHFVVIAPYIFDISLTKLYDEKHCYTMSVQDFKLELLDILMIFKKKDIHIEESQAIKLLEYTKGWAPAVELAIKGYQEGGSFFDTSQLEELLYKAKFEGLLESDIVSLIQLSLLPKFSLELCHYLCNDKHVERLITHLTRNKLFIQKIDFNTYCFSSIFKSYLNEAVPRYDIKKNEVYEKAALWYIEQNDYLTAIRLLMEGGLFNSILKIMSESSFSYVDFAPELMQEVFLRMPSDCYYKAPYVYLSYISDMMTNIDPYQGMKLLEEFKEDLLDGKYQEDVNQLMGEYYYIRAFSKFNDVSLMMDDFYKAYTRFKGESSKVAYPGMVASFGSYQLLYLYHHTPGKLLELCLTIKEKAKYFIKISHGCNAGSEYQVEAEYNYITGNYTEVESLARAAYDVAYMQKQLSICICANLQFGRLALLKDRDLQFQFIIQDMDTLYSRCKNPILKKQIDCALAYLFILKDEENQVAQWIIQGDFNALELMHEAEGLPYIIHMLYLLKKKKYNGAEACCRMIEYSNQPVIHAFALLYGKLVRTICYFNTGKQTQANCILKELLETAKKDHIVSIFLEFYKELFPIFESYKAICPFEKEVYEKIKVRYHKFNKNENHQLNHLTEREKEVALMYIDSYTSKEIAEKLVISHNTVLTHIKSVYTKLEISKKKELILLMGHRKKITNL